MFLAEAMSFGEWQNTQARAVCTEGFQYSRPGYPQHRAGYEPQWGLDLHLCSWSRYLESHNLENAPRAAAQQAERLPDMAGKGPAHAASLDMAHGADAAR